MKSENLQSCFNTGLHLRHKTSLFSMQLRVSIVLVVVLISDVRNTFFDFFLRAIMSRFMHNWRLSFACYWA